MKNPLSRFPYFITGDSYGELQKYDRHSRKKIITLGNFVLIPTLLWFITGYLIAWDILHASIHTAIIVGIISAFLIFIFERSIVQSKKVHWALVVSRVVMGLCIAVFSSAILDLIIFKNDIRQFANTEQVNERRTELQNQVQDQTIFLQKAQETNDHLQQTFINEMNGHGGSGIIGYGIIAKQKQQLLLKAQSNLNVEKVKLDSLQQVLSNFNSAPHTFSDVTLGMNTVLTRLKLLHGFVSQNWMALVAWLIFLVIGVFLELFCILTKLFSSKTAYELDLEANEKILANRRERLLQQNEYYTQLSVREREVADSMKKERVKVLG